MTIHRLKSWPPYFEAVKGGRKTFEVRKDDREFHVGDFLELHEWDPATNDYTGREYMVVVLYVSDLSPIGCPGFIGLGIR